MIYVCGLDEMPMYAAALRPSRLVSVVGPDEVPPTPSGLMPEDHLRVICHDIVEPVSGFILPEAHHVQALIEFAARWNPAQPMLVHCLAGVSRSTAAALIAGAVHVDGRENELARRLRTAGPHANPNRRMIALADGLLEREGRLVAAVEAIGPGLALGSGSLVELPLQT